MAMPRLTLVVPLSRIEWKCLHHEDIAKSNLEQIYYRKRKGFPYDYPNSSVGTRPSKAEPPWRETAQQSSGRRSKAVVLEQESLLVDLGQPQDLGGC